MKLVRVLFVAHLFALAFGLAGLLIILPHPQVWDGNKAVVQALPYALRYTGSTHILFGAATMIAFGVVCIGWRKTLTFFVIATLLPLCMELLGTGTGFPFGAYHYTENLGAKVLGRVPFSIPLSWFYMGFTSYLLATAILGRTNLRHKALWNVALGAYLLTAWDLVLDPAMASHNLVLRFWVWGVNGIYFGMPLRNFVGWAATGFLFMGLSRLAWRDGIAASEYPTWLPFGMYAANVVFAIILSLGAGLWIPPIIALVLGLFPAYLAWRSQSAGGGMASGVGPDIARFFAMRSIRMGARRLAAGHLRVLVAGAEHVPASGPVLIVARHYHHLYDGCALLDAIPRPLHILVALDWAPNRLTRFVMELACKLAQWPVVLRQDAHQGDGGSSRFFSRSAYLRDEAAHYLRRAVRESVALLRSGETLVVFPEGYPNVDPAFTPKRDEDDFLPFRSGFLKLIEAAQRDGVTRVTIVPAGFSYQREGAWTVGLRFGQPVTLDGRFDRAAVLAEVEEQVRVLSRPLPELSVVSGDAIHPSLSASGDVR